MFPFFRRSRGPTRLPRRPGELLESWWKRVAAKSERTDREVEKVRRESERLKRRLESEGKK